MENETLADEVSSTSLLSLLGMQAQALMEVEESESKRLMDDLLEIKLQKLELQVGR